MTSQLHSSLNFFEKEVKKYSAYFKDPERFKI